MIEFASALVLLWLGYKLGRSGIERRHKAEVESLEELDRRAIELQNLFIQEAEFLLGETGDTAETNLWMHQSPEESLEDAMFAAGKTAGVAVFQNSITSVLKFLGAIDKRNLREADTLYGSPQTKALKEEIRKRRKEMERRGETRKLKDEERARVIKSLLGESIVPGHPLSEFRRRFLRLLEAKSRR